jgi:predicted Zn-dependent protease
MLIAVQKPMCGNHPIGFCVRIAMRRAILLLIFAMDALAQDLTLAAREAGLGAQMSGEVRRTSSLIRDPAVRSYVSHLATKLIGPQFLLTLEVTDDDRGFTHEPIWLPGGYMFVSAALIRTARDEAEFAGMFAHALAHEINHDNMRIAARMQTGTIPLIFLGGEPWPGLGPSIGQLRPFEQQADEQAVKMISDIGYDPEALVRYIARVSPADTERLEAIRKAVGDLPPQESSVVDSSDFQRIREKLSPANGSVGNNFPPTLRRPYER